MQLSIPQKDLSVFPVQNCVLAIVMSSKALSGMKTVLKILYDDHIVLLRFDRFCRHVMNAGRLKLVHVPHG